MSKDFPQNAGSNGTRGAEAAGHSFVESLGQSMRALEVVIRELARNEVPVLLLAEGGAGKEATAERIHQMSAHRGEPLRMIACADVTEDQFGDGQRLFGKGTVYLEEVADL